MNITFISDEENKKGIKSKAPSEYIGSFENKNENIEKALATHFIKLDFGIADDNYEHFLEKRAELIFNELKKRLGETNPS